MVDMEIEWVVDFVDGKVEVIEKLKVCKCYGQGVRERARSDC